MRFNIILMPLALLLTATVSLGKTIYVDDNATGVNDGSSWENAYIYLQDALAYADSAEKPVEIRVAQGIYKPDMGAGITSGDRDVSFKLISGVSLSGGYAGVFEPDPNEKNYDKYETILSGDLAGNDIYTNDPNDLINEPTREENSYHVITTYYPDSASGLYGVTISSGNGKLSTSGGRRGGNSGGGLQMGSGMLRIYNCTFINNLSDNGAGILNASGHLTLINCIFKVNAASNGSGIYNYYEGELKLVNCTFENNYALNKGGGIYNEDSKITIANTSFKNNSASDGGAIYLHDSYRYSSLKNILFSGNSAENNGGAIYIEQNHNGMKITQATLAQNSGLNGSALYFSSEDGLGYIKLSNCILNNSGQQEIFIESLSPIQVSYCNIQNGQSAIYDPNGVLVWGEGNIETDPLFYDPNSGDCHLKSQAGRFDSETENWVIDSNTSPCIDAGDQMSPISSEPFPNGGIINMGSYGGTVEASKTYFGEPVCEAIIAGDINGDCRVDFADIEILLRHWLEDGRPVSLKVIDGVEFCIQTDKTFYKSGENVQMEFTVTNLTNEGIHIGCYQAPEFNLSVEKDEENIWELNSLFLQYSPGIDLAAGQSQELSYSWDMKDNYGYQVGPGTYHVVGIMYAYNFLPENQGIPEVRIPITISGANEP